MSGQQIVFTVVIIVICLALFIWIARRRRKKTSTGEGVIANGQEANKQVYVGNLSYQVTEQDLKDYFGKFGNIAQVRIVRNYSSGRSKGFGFVTYSRVDEANKSLVAHGEKYQGRTIVVRIAKPR